MNPSRSCRDRGVAWTRRKGSQSAVPSPPRPLSLCLSLSLSVCLYVCKSFRWFCLSSLPVSQCIQSSLPPSLPPASPLHPSSNRALRFRGGGACTACRWAWAGWLNSPTMGRSGGPAVARKKLRGWWRRAATRRRRCSGRCACCHFIDFSHAHTGAFEPLICAPVHPHRHSQHHASASSGLPHFSLRRAGSFSCNSNPTKVAEKWGREDEV
jgi:hypothetical protein